MSNRVIKDGIWTSKKLVKCSYLSQLHYPRLYLLIDDWSCFEVDIDVIKGTVYPKLPEVSLKDIEGILYDFEANGLLFVWGQNGTRYGYFTGNEEGRLDSPSRRHKRHTPEPPQKELVAYLKRFNNLQDEPTKAYEKDTVAYNLDTRGYKVHTKKRPNLNPNPNPNPNPSSCPRSIADVDRTLTQLLIDLMLKNNPESSTIKRLTQKGKDNWANQCRLLRETDKRSPQQIEAVIRFSQTDSFWRQNILSMSKLREKWDQLWLKAQGQGNGRGEYKPSQIGKYIPPTAAEKDLEKKLITEYEEAQRKFMAAKGYKTEEDIPFNEFETFSMFKARRIREIGKSSQGSKA